MEKETLLKGIQINNDIESLTKIVDFFKNSNTVVIGNGGFTETVLIPRECHRIIWQAFLDELNMKQKQLDEL